MAEIIDIVVFGTRPMGARILLPSQTGGSIGQSFRDHPVRK